MLKLFKAGQILIDCHCFLLFISLEKKTYILKRILNIVPLYRYHYGCAVNDILLHLE